MKINFKILSMLILALLVYLLFSYLYVKEMKIAMTAQKYSEISKEMKNRLSTLIAEKKEAVSLVSLSLSLNDFLKKALLSKDTLKLDLSEFSKVLRKESSLKNVWFQLLDADGTSTYRSWTPKHGDSLVNSRLDVAQMLKEHRTRSSISTGKFDMTFKTMVPIYKGKEFIGIVETIAKFNSIVIKMHQIDAEVLVVIDRSYKKQLSKAFEKRFVKDYYVANIHPDKKIFDIFKNQYFAKLLNIEDYFIDKKNSVLFATYQIDGLDSKPMGHFILSKELSYIDMSEIDSSHERNIAILLIVGILIVIFIYYIFTINYKNFIIRQNEKLERNVKSKTKELYHTAHHDSLTGLPNRLLFLDRLKQILRYSARDQKNVAVLFLDLDRFKEVNDTYGHHIGDELLIQVTNVLKSCVRDEDTIARLGGDEFTIILKNIKSNDMIKVTKKIINKMQETFFVEKLEIHTSFSIGISSFPDDGLTTDELLSNADIAMYRAKELGKNNFQFYDRKMTKMALSRTKLENDIRRALAYGEFEPYFQVKVNATTQEVIGVEALIRWNHPEDGLVFPNDFIPFAEEFGLLSEIDNFMMYETMKITKAWLDKGLSFGRLSLNVSTKELDDESFVHEIREAVSENNYETKYLELEILESQSIKNQEKVIKILSEIQNSGISISIDDFGTGYSSLSYLKKLPIDKIKIDRSFIKDLPQDKDSIAIVKTIIALAKNLDLGIIAEGVETKEQVDFLLAEGCEKIQGYYYSKPIRASEFEKLLKTKVKL